MSFAVALLCHPVGTLTALVGGIVSALYAAQSRRFLPAFTAVSAGLLTMLAFLMKASVVALQKFPNNDALWAAKAAVL